MAGYNENTPVSSVRLYAIDRRGSSVLGLVRSNHVQIQAVPSYEKTVPEEGN